MVISVSSSGASAGSAPVGTTIRIAGTNKGSGVIDVRLIVGPASYSSGGFAVDQSANFGAIYKAFVIRAYVTSSNATDGRFYRVIENGTNTFANKKFVIICEMPFPTTTPAGTNSAPTFTGSAATSSAVSAGTPAGTNSAPTISLVNGAVTDKIVGNTGNNSVLTNSGNGAVSGLTGVQAPTFTGSALGTHTHTVTATGTNSAPTFTGMQISQAGFQEVSATTDLSGVTVEVLILGN